jgi:hypothetical protein
MMEETTVEQTRPDHAGLKGTLSDAAAEPSWDQRDLAAAGAAAAVPPFHHPFVHAPARPPMSRWRAASIHLGICAGIALIIGAALLFVWYPSPLFAAQGGQSLLLMLFGIDVVVGPCITAIIFDTRKKNLRFDLTVIAVMQAIALAYGVSIAFQARPAFLVFFKDWIEVIPANAMESKLLDEAKFPEFRSLSVTGPKLIAAEMPTDNEERNRMIFSAGFGADVTYFPKYYVPYDDAKSQTLLKAKTISELRQLNPKKQAVIDKFLAAHQHTDDTTRYLPVKTRGDFVTAFVDSTTGDFLGMAALVPW